MLAPLRKPTKKQDTYKFAASILDVLAYPVILITREGTIDYANAAAEAFFAASASVLRRQRLDTILPTDSPVFTLLAQARASNSSVTQDSVTLQTPRIGSHLVSLSAVPLNTDSIVLSIQERSIASTIDRQLTHRHAARSVTAMAAMLAHEVKNPLSGIRGAAQLLEEGASKEERQLTQLIVTETDRICAMVDRMEAFSDLRPLARSAVNIHEVLTHVQQVATSGFAHGIRFIEAYDPSLPPVHGNRDLLIQAFLNLVKNAAEACAEGEGEICLTTRYQHGVRLAVPGTTQSMDLPLLITIQDNGSGIPDDLLPHMFDAFVTTKIDGKGLGLAMVAKIVGDHGGVIDVQSQPGRTTFRVMLPMQPRSTTSMTHISAEDREDRR
ncbi:MAG: ATP-binding protein [Alphaproteobacteria bacterium]